MKLKVEAQNKFHAIGPSRLVRDLYNLIDNARTAIARTFSSAQVMLYWDIGDRIRAEVLKKRRATYGEEIVQTLSAQLTKEFGRGFSRRNVFNMVRFAEIFDD